MDEYYEEYLEEAIIIAESNFDITKDEVIYNSEHFEQCYENGIDVEKAVFLLSNFCI